MRRRDVLRCGAALAAAGAFGCRAPAGRAEGTVMTVAGPVRPEALGPTLPHEHLMSTFGAPAAAKAVYDEEALFEAVLPALRRVRDLGCRTIADCTAAYFGRAPQLLRRLSDESGVQLLTNTGYYGAAQDRYVPAHAYRESADRLAERWLAEWRDGIDGTGIRPGFIKVGVDEGALSEIDRKLVRAAALTHRESGLAIAVHTGNNPAAAREQLRILREEGVAPEAWIWVHAHAAEDVDALAAAAGEGAWLSLDGLGAETLERHRALVLELKRRGLLARVLLSHDGNSYRPGGRPRPYEALFTRFRELLAGGGLTPAEIRAVTEANPGRAFTVRVRAA